MYEKFENLPEEKRKKILDICIEEFSQHSYKNASTNTIVKNAEISKGVLFHYFGNKKNLYLYVFDHVLNFAMQYILERLDKIIADSQADIFDRIMNTGLIKLEMSYKHPEIYKFLFNAVLNTPEELKGEMQLRQEKAYKESMPLLLSGIDTSKFRKDINKEKAIEIIMLSVEGINNKYMKTFKNMQTEKVLSSMENILREYEEYIDILKKGIYAD